MRTAQELSADRLPIDNRHPQIVGARWQFSRSRRWASNRACRCHCGCVLDHGADPEGASWDVPSPAKRLEDPITRKFPISENFSRPRCFALDMRMRHTAGHHGREAAILPPPTTSQEGAGDKLQKREISRSDAP
jgi:hypothetical protein